MSALLREVARSLRHAAQNSTVNHCAVMVLALRDDGTYESLCWADEDAAEAAIRELPKAANDFARQIAGGYQSGDGGLLRTEHTPAALLAAERMTAEIIGRVRG